MLKFNPLTGQLEFAGAGGGGGDGADGADGVGVPTGGTAGQLLTKDSSTDFDTSWQDPASSGLTYSQIISITSLGV